jgi:hypothetical protein
MGYIEEPKDVDLVVAPSVLTDAIKNEIMQAIAQYKKTGHKPVERPKAKLGRTERVISQSANI